MPENSSSEVNSCSIQATSSAELEKMKPKGVDEALFTPAAPPQSPVDRILEQSVQDEDDTGEAIQQCSYKTQNKQQKSDPPCEFSAVKISKPGRKYDLIVQAASNPSPDGLVYEIISGYSDGKESTVNVDVNGLVGPCDSHNGETVQVSAKQADIVKLTSDSAEFKCRYLSPTEVVKKLFSLKPKRYEVSIKTCDAIIPRSVVILVFPEIEFSVKLAVDLSKPTKSNTGTIQRKEEHKNVGLTISGSYSGHNLEWSTEAKKILTFLQQVAKGATSIRKIISQTAKIGPFDFELGGPVIALELANVEFKEISGSPKVDIQYTIGLKLDPLVKAELKLDILDALSMLAGPVAKIIAGIRSTAKKYGSNVEFNFIVEGDIGGAIEAKKMILSNLETGNAKISASVLFKFEAILEVDVEFVFIKVQGVAKAAGITKFYAELGFVDSGSKGVAIEGKIGCEGIKITLVVSGNLERERTTPQKHGRSKTGSVGNVTKEKKQIESGVKYENVLYDKFEKNYFKKLK